MARLVGGARWKRAVLLTLSRIPFKLNRYEFHHWYFYLQLVLDCLVLILLILMQLPKKEAGIGLAFGGAATDALFGAGSGTALTKLTKYTAGYFLVMTMLLTVLNANQAKNSGQSFENQLKQAAKTMPPPEPPPTASNTTATPAIVPTNAMLMTASNAVASATNTPLMTASNIAATASNTPAKAAAPTNNPSAPEKAPQ